MTKRILPLVSLLCSLSTLVCCALPALFVSLGAGATLVSLLANVPQLIWFSEHKGLVFGVAGALLIANGLVRGRGGRSCPTDPALAAACQQAQRVSGVLFYGSVVVYCLGAFFAFVAPLVVS